MDMKVEEELSRSTKEKAKREVGERGVRSKAENKFNTSATLA